MSHQDARPPTSIVIRTTSAFRNDVLTGAAGGAAAAGGTTLAALFSLLSDGNDFKRPLLILTPPLTAIFAAGLNYAASVVRQRRARKDFAAAIKLLTAAIDDPATPEGRKAEYQVTLAELQFMQVTASVERAKKGLQ